MGHCAEKKAAEKALRQSRIRGSLIGGAAGDALGYSVESIISDDTQMTLFTACGILIAETSYQDCASVGTPADCLRSTYLDWLETQGYSRPQPASIPRAWITDIPELRHRRAPGNTCLGALNSPENGSILEPLNNSKGCGGIMRVAPYGLYYSGPHDSDDFMLEDAAESVAITHGHPLGYLPSVAVVYILHEIMANRVNSREDVASVAREACAKCRELFGDEPYDIDKKYLDELDRINELAIELAMLDSDDLENIHRIGEGWVGEETYGIALYCCLKYYGDFGETIRTAVNHSGDSDSTGAVAGNIMGAIVGYEAIDDVWKTNLELSDVILEIADDLAEGPKANGLGTTDYWLERYGQGKLSIGVDKCVDNMWKTTY